MTDDELDKILDNIVKYPEAIKVWRQDLEALIIQAVRKARIEELQKADMLLRRKVLAHDSPANASDKTVMLAWFADRLAALQAEEKP